MATPSAPASLSFSEINTELGRASTTSINLNETGIRNLAGVQSGAISLSNLRGRLRYPQTFEWEGVGGGGSGSGGSTGAGGGAGKYAYGIAATLNYGAAGTTFSFQVGGSDTFTQSTFSGTLQAGGNGGSQANYNYNGGPGFGGGGGQGGQRSQGTAGGNGQAGGYPGGRGASYNQGPGYGGGGGGGYNFAGGAGSQYGGGGAGGGTISTIRGTAVSGGGNGASNLGQPGDAPTAYSGRGGEGGNAGAGAGGSGYFCIRCTDTAAIAVTTGSPTVTTGGGSRTYFFTGSGTLQWA